MRGGDQGKWGCGGEGSLEGISGVEKDNQGTACGNSGKDCGPHRGERGMAGESSKLNKVPSGFYPAK